MLCCVPCDSVSISSPSGTEVEESGRSVRAVRAIQPGQSLLKNAPTVHLLLVSLWGERCLNCLSAQAKLSTCTKCKRATYCSRECQKQDWGQHKLECKNIPKLWERLDTNVLNEVFVLLRLSAINKTLPVDCVLSSDGSTVQCGSEHIHELHVGAPMANLQDDFSQLVLHLAQQITERPMEQIVSMLRQFRSNNFGITDELINCIGIGVYPSAALLNHSCAPNCILRYHLEPTGPVVHVVSICEIAPGEELTHSYVDCGLPRALRRARLQEIYGFVCHCRLCALTESTADEDIARTEGLVSCVNEYLLIDPQLERPLRLRQVLNDWAIEHGGRSRRPLVRVDALLAQPLTEKIPWQEEVMDKMLHQLDVDIAQADSNQQLESCLLRLQKVEAKVLQSFPVYHLNVHKIRGKMLTVQLLLNDFSAAYRTCAQIVSYLVLSLFNVEYHPLLGVQLFTLADLAGMAGQEPLARPTYEWCDEILKITHKDGELRKRLQTLIDN